MDVFIWVTGFWQDYCKVLNEGLDNYLRLVCCGYDIHYKMAIFHAKLAKTQLITYMHTCMHRPIYYMYMLSKVNI